jgi:hypothetical protein
MDFGLPLVSIGISALILCPDPAGLYARVWYHWGEQIEEADDMDDALLAPVRFEVTALGLYGFNLRVSMAGGRV